MLSGKESKSENSWCLLFFQRRRLGRFENLLIKKKLSSRGSSRRVSRYINSSTQRNPAPSWLTLQAAHNTVSHMHTQTHRHSCGSAGCYRHIRPSFVHLTCLEADWEVLHDLGVQPAVIILKRLWTTAGSDCALVQSEGLMELCCDQICQREKPPALDPLSSMDNRMGRANLDLWGIGERPHSHCGRSQPGSVRNTWWILPAVESAVSLDKGTCWWSHLDSWREKWRADPMDVLGVDLDAQTAAVHLDGVEGIVFRADVSFTGERSHSDGVPLLHQWQVVAEGPVQEQLRDSDYRQQLRLSLVPLVAAGLLVFLFRFEGGECVLTSPRYEGGKKPQ